MEAQGIGELETISNLGDSERGHLREGSFQADIGEDRHPRQRAVCVQRDGGVSHS